MDYYKFCSSMLSSNCGFNKANSVKHLFDVESIAAATSNRAAEEWSCKKRGGRASGKPRYSHRGEFWSAQAIRNALEDDVLSEFYD